jgi:hypothetical protein
VERRFGGRGRQAGAFVPLLNADAEIPQHQTRALSRRLGVRSDLTPSDFTIEDAELLCRRMAHLFEESEITRRLLRQQIRPVYRQLFELLAGRSESEAAKGALNQVPLLAVTPNGFEFLPAADILYASTAGITERTRVADRLATFVIEADPSATAPLTNLFGVRNLESVLDWHPDPGESALNDDAALEEFRSSLRDLRTPLLARIRTERANPRDLPSLCEFVDMVEPVEDLRLTCTLDGEQLDHLTDRPYFIRPASRSSFMQAFVVWGPDPWPPTPDAAQALAMALADALGINLVETFLAFIQSSPHQRGRLLEIAGATSYIEEVEAQLDDPETGLGAEEEQPEDEPTTTTPAEPHAGMGEQPATRESPGPPPARVPLVRFRDLLLDGVPITLAGEPGRHEAGGRTVAGHSSGGETGSTRAPAGLDLGDLDRLGMQITLGYELRRLRRDGLDPALIRGDSVESGRSSLVVAVHTPEAIRHAEEASPVVRAVLDGLESDGISRSWPGFDILTIVNGVADRLIELKSSGVDARVQTMTWNEWKSARTSELREVFWLYLVGNLRADIHNATPFVRAIQDPFGSLMSETITEQSIRRAVQLRVREFERAEHLDLELSTKPEGS